MLNSTLLAAAVLAANTWTVDDNGPADFSSIAIAIPQVAAGDTLLVKNGVYLGFTVDKPLTIVGQVAQPKPTITTPVTIAPIASCTLAGFALMQGLSAGHVSGRLAIDDCKIDAAQNALAMQLSSCGEALVSRSTIQASISTIGAQIIASNVTIVASTINGGNGQDFSQQADNGELALIVSGGSKVLIAGSSLQGGAAGFDDSSVQGSSGGAILAANGSTVTIRGRSSNVVTSGAWSPFGTPGVSIQAIASSTVVVSGVSFGSTSTSGGATILTPSPAEPWMQIVGADAPTQFRVIELYGPAGAPAILFASLKPALLTSPLVEQPLWFDPSALRGVIPLATAGPSTAVSLPVQIPTTPGIAGLTLEAQAVFTTLPGTLAPNKLQASNAANLIVRF